MNIAVQTRESSEIAANAGEVELIASSENHSVAHTLEPDPIELDPRPCELCGLTIDRREMVDDGDGPEFFCYPDDDIVKLWELADRRDSWRHTGELPPPEKVRNSAIVPAESTRPHYRTAQATVDAFWIVVRRADPERLTAWLDNHPQDESFLLKLLERK